MAAEGSLPYRTTLVALAVGQLLCWAALFYGFSSFVAPMQGALGWTQAEVMGAFTLGLAVSGCASYAVGAAIDRGRGRAVLTVGAAFGGAGFLLWSRAEGLPMFYAAWALLGAAMAMTLYEPVFAVLTKRFPERFREGITALTLVGGFASTLSFPLVAWLIAQLGWRGALQAIGVLLLVGVAPLHAWALRGAPMPPAAARTHDAADDTTLHEALHHAAFWLVAATFTLYAFLSAALWAHLMPAFAAKGLSQAEALAVVVWFGPAQVAGRFVFLGAGHHVTTRALGLVVLAGVPIALAIFALADRVAALTAFAVLFGLANGLVTIVRGSLVPEYWGRAHVGRISGAISAIALLARAAAPLASAALLGAVGGYPGLLLGLAALGAAAVVTFALARPPG